MKRDIYWDSLKLVLVFLVVLSHCVGSYKPSGGINQSLYNFLLTFLMPTFIFVSGMFSQINDREKYLSGILRIFETYAVFQLIRAVGPMILSGHVTLTSIVSIIIIPCYTLWYLLCLIFYRLMVYFMPGKILRDNPIGVIIICFLISLLGGFIPVDRQFSLQRTMTYLPFFFMGYYARNIDVKKYIAKIPLILALGVLLSAYLIFYLILYDNINYVLFGKNSYWYNAGFSPFLLCLFRLIFLISAIITGTMVMRLVMAKPSFSEWGKITLFIYIYHSFFIQAMRFVFKHWHLPQYEWMYFLMSVIIMIVLIFLSKIKFFHILLNPVSYLTEKIKERRGE